jgi:hypothetical protein
MSTSVTEVVKVCRLVRLQSNRQYEHDVVFIFASVAFVFDWHAEVDLLFMLEHQMRSDQVMCMQELTQKISEMKEKAEQSEVMVQEICRDIKKLDFAKKNITTTITALHRLAMLGLFILSSSSFSYYFGELKTFFCDRTLFLLGQAWRRL